MNAKYAFWVSIVFFFSAYTATAQRVQRKGVTPIDVSHYKTKKGKKVPVFDIETFAGKWQESDRLNRGNESVEITDTFFINFVARKEVYTWKGLQPRQVGEAFIEKPGNILFVNSYEFTIYKADSNELVLFDQDKYFHVFKKVALFYDETLGKQQVEKESIKGPISLHIKNIKGNWLVYKREAKPGLVKPQTVMIKRIIVSESISEDSATGKITIFHSDEAKEIPCIFKINNAGFDIVAQDYTESVFVYKAADNELIFGDTEKILYYSKAD